MALYGSRNLAEFDLGTQYSNVEYHWVPSGAAVTSSPGRGAYRNLQQVPRPARAPRRITATCRTLRYVPHTADHGSRHWKHPRYEGDGYEDSRRPSVLAGKPYVIIGNRQSVNDFSNVTFPQELNKCQSLP